MKKTDVLLLCVVMLVLVWSLWAPQDTMLTWVLEAAPVLVGLPIVVYSYYRGFRMTTVTNLFLALHCCILLYGAHYSYAEAPLGFWMEDWFGWTRNNYDKIGHFAQGFGPVLYAREILLRGQVLPRRGWLNFILFSIAMMISAVYEIIEWVASIPNPEDTEAFLGTQGYVWDTQSDMFLCMVGAIVALLFFAKLQDREMDV